MPRRTPRFKNLMRELKRTNGNPAAGSEAAKFLAYLTGERKIQRTNTLPPSATKRLKMGVLPFGVSAETTTDQDYFEATITRYSYAGLKKINLDVDHYGLKFYNPAFRDEDDFYPALIKPSFYSGVGNDNSRQSGVTGDNYNYRRTRSFSIPFGRTIETGTKDAKKGTQETILDQSDERDVLKSLRQKIKSSAAAADAQTPLASVGYEPEYFQEAREVQGATDDTTFSVGDITLN